MLVSGTLPFNGTSKPEVYGKIRKGIYKQPKSCSENCKDLLKKMLTVDPAMRPSAVDCLNHPWFEEMQAKDPAELNQDPQLQERIIANLKEFKGQSELRRASLNIFVKMCQPKEYD